MGAGGDGEGWGPANLGSRKGTDSGRIRQEDAEHAQSAALSLEHDCCLNAYGFLRM